MTAQAVRRRAVGDALRMPSVVLLASMIGFGSLAHDSGLTLAMALVTTAGVWGLPGQIALAELQAAGSGALAVIVACSMANARFLPMAVSFMPMLRAGLPSQARLYALVQLLAVNSWIGSLRAFPAIPPALRRLYFATFAGVCFLAGLIGTTLGFAMTGALPRSITLGLVFVNPVFFALVFTGTRGRPMVLALGIGAVCGPPFHWLSPDWSLLLTGLVAGTAAFLAARVLPGRAR